MPVQLAFELEATLDSHKFFIDDLVGIEPTQVPKDRAPLRVEATAEAIASPLRVLLFSPFVNRN